MAKNLLNELPPNEAVEKHLPQLFESYPELGKGYQRASFFLWSDNPSVPTKVYLLAPCHAYLSYLDPGYDHMITAVPEADELSLMYLRMLCSGPFRAVSDLISLECVGKNYFIRCTDLQKWPANVLLNFCIATRIPTEYKAYLKRFGALVDKGYNPTLAFLLSYSTAGKEPKPDYISREFPSANHLWLDPASDWGLILRGEMIKITPPFKEYPKGTTPCNLIWGNSTDYKQLIYMPDEEVSAFYKLPIEITPPPPPKKKGAIAAAGGLDAYIAQVQAQQGVVHPVGQPIPPVNFAPINNIWAEIPAPAQPMHVIVDDDDDDEDDLDDWDPEPDFDEDEDD